MDVDALLHALNLERVSGQLTRRWLDAGGRESPVYDILERHAVEDDRHAETLWGILVDRGVSPPETHAVESPEDFPQTLISLKEELVTLYDRLLPQLPGRERQAVARVRDDDDDQRALLSVYFPPVGERV